MPRGHVLSLYEERTQRRTKEKNPRFPSLEPPLLRLFVRKRNAVALLRQLHAERGLSYSALIVPAVNAYYGKPTADESLRETIRSIVREELAAPSVQLGDLLQTLNIVTSSTAPSPIRSDEPDDDDLDDALDSFGC